MSSPPPPKRKKSSPSNATTGVDISEGSALHDSITAPNDIAPPVPPVQILQPNPPIGSNSNISPTSTAPIAPPVAATTPNPRKRRASHSPKLDTLPPGTSRPSESTTNVSIPALLSEDSGRRRGRTNTPWTPLEEQRLKQMRDAGNSWSEIAKAFPARTEGSVKKHWYKDMHYAEFAEDESLALREAIKEYENNKWKTIGQKLGKPAKACEQYAKEHFKNL